jgi:hypothetical protein
VSIREAAYIVEAVDAGGYTRWLADFVAEELEFVAPLATAAVHLERTTGPLELDDFVAHPSGRLLQVCRATVGTAEFMGQFAVVLATDADAASITLDSLVAMMTGETADTIAVLVRESAKGRATVEVERARESCAFPIAAAVAVMLASWAWDESPTIVVTVNATPVAIAPRFAGDGWTATS